MMAIDCDNTDWLAAQMREIGWFDIPRYGKEADQDAWMLVQHADRNKAFQRETLAYLEDWLPERRIRATLRSSCDRVAMGEGRPQRYGTQGMCAPDGNWAPHEVEDPAGSIASPQALGLTTDGANTASAFAGVCPRIGRK